MSSPPPIPRRARAEVLRQHPAFQSVVVWLAALFLREPRPDVTAVSLDSVEPTLRDRLEEEALRACASLDPTLERVARYRARQLAAERLAQLLTSTDVELADPAFLEERAAALADVVIDRYRYQLAYGIAPAQVQS